MPSPKDNLGASARRGILFISAAKLWFLVAGLAMQLLLPRALGSAALFGVWTLVLSWVSAVNNVMITATIQGVSFFASAGEAAVEQAKRTALRMQVLVGGGTALLFYLAAPWLAAFERDAALIPELRLAAGVVLCYSFYAVFVGAANGARHFHKQAGLDISFSTLRVLLVVGAAWIWHSTLAAVGGFVAAAGLILGVSAAVVGLPRDLGGAPIQLRQMLRMSAWLGVYLLASNILLFLDGWWLKRLLTEQMAGWPDAKQRVDTLIGIYGAAQTVARLPYQLCLAGTFVVFPLMSAAALTAPAEQIRRYIAATLRYALLAAAALAAVLLGRPEAVMRLLYPPEYAQGGPALLLLLLAYLGLSLFAIAGAILNGIGRIRLSSALGLTTVLGTTAAVYLLVRTALPAGLLSLERAALGMLLGLVAGLLATLACVYWIFRATLSPWTLLRVALASAGAVILARLWPAPGTGGLAGSKPGTLLCMALCGLVYLAVLALSGELSLQELRRLRRPPHAPPQGPAG
ncbi:MAG: oligosaccharide flippase family protein [Myxococcales bacterium]|nr:oligosaccharide flippase family protein [Myxococcota bacterium]MDW8281202.1 oligosaccharide flippase family protein [Myxococcales bacterium]